MIQYEAAAMGDSDTAVNREWLYILTDDSNSVVVEIDGDGGKEVQHYSLKAEGVDGHWQSMAAWSRERGEMYGFDWSPSWCGK